MSLGYASGPYKTEELKPSSAFSEGDVLMLDSTSSVSGQNVTFASGVDIYGIAASASTASINGKVVVILPEQATVFWASLATNLSSAATPGTDCDLLYGNPNGGWYVDPTSQNSVRATIFRGTEQIDQSIVSRALVQLIFNAGNIDLS